MNRRELDKFYTNPEAAKTFINLVEDHFDLSSFDNIIEPSAGDGALLKLLPEGSIGVDLEPEAEGIIKHNFLTWEAPLGRNIIVGNPPFGNRSKLAIEFFKRAAEFSEVIAFIIPVTWEKYSIHKQLPAGWALIASERLPENSFLIGDDPYRVRCTMQLWVKQTPSELRLLAEPTGDNPYFDFVSKDDDWDAVVYNSPPKTILRGGEVKRFGYYLKAKLPGVIETLSDIKWQSNENTAMLDGMKIPGLTKSILVKVFENEYNKRLYSRPTGANPYFDFVTKDECEFAIRQAYPKTVRKEDIDGQSHYFIKPKVGGVWEVFSSFEWQSEENRLMLGGAKVPCLDKDTVVKFYEKYANLRKDVPEPTTHEDFSFVKVDEDWDVSILILTNPKAPARRWLTGFSQEEGKSRVNRIYIKFHNEEARKIMTSISIDGNMTDGMMPRVTPGLIVKYYTQAKAGRKVDVGDLRKMEKEVGKHEDFTFVGKDADWDFCMSTSPCIVRSREYFNEKGGAYCNLFIKANVPDLEETFNTIAWQSAEAKKHLTGARFPVADTADIVKIYSLFKEGLIPAKKGDWRKQKERAKVRKKHDYRKTSPEPGTHPDFIISSRYNPNAEFVIRGVRPVVSDEIDVYNRISDNTRYYSVQPLVEGVREVFENVNWEEHWQGVSMPTVSIPDCIEIYNKLRVG